MEEYLESIVQRYNRIVGIDDMKISIEYFRCTSTIAFKICGIDDDHGRRMLERGHAIYQKNDRVYRSISFNFFSVCHLRLMFLLNSKYGISPSHATKMASAILAPIGLEIASVILKQEDSILFCSLYRHKLGYFVVEYGDDCNDNDAWDEANLIINISYLFRFIGRHIFISDAERPGVWYMKLNKN